MSMYPTIDEFECPHYRCKNCIHFKFVTPQNPHGCTHRFDHAKMEYAHPWFVNVPEERGCICRDFEPNGGYPAAIPYWHGYDHYIEWRERQEVEDCGGEERYNRLKTQNNLIGFELKQEPDVRYYVRLEDYVNGTMWDDNRLKAVKKGYYKRTKSGFGYKWIREKIDGVEVN